MSNIDVRVDIREYAPKDRYPTVIYTFDQLTSGQRMELINDHDLKPLLRYKLLGEREGQFEWKYLEEGPEVWRVAVTKH